MRTPLLSFRTAPRGLSAPGLRAACAIGVFACCLLPAAVGAAPLLRCQIDQGGSTMVRDFAPVADPYGVAAIDINGRFRFKAVVLGDAQRVEYVKLYVYAANKRQPMLLHETNYPAPAASRDASPASLTGINYVYSPLLERELRYGCVLLEVMP